MCSQPPCIVSLYPWTPSDRQNLRSFEVSQQEKRMRIQSNFPHNFPLTNKGLLPPHLPEALDKIRYCHLKIAAADPSIIFFPQDRERSPGRRWHCTGRGKQTVRRIWAGNEYGIENANTGQATVAQVARALVPVLVADRLAEAVMEKYTRVTP